jgi:AraC-like DNA-binding protein
MQLESRLATPGIELVLVDPSADGTMNVGAIARILNRNLPVPVVAYVTLTNENLKAVMQLYKYGLSEALLHPFSEKRLPFREFANRCAGNRVAYGFLGLFQNRLMRLEPRLVGALMDLFERPHRYDTAADIGRESALSPKRVYRALTKAQLGTPKKLVIAAKILRGYAYLRETRGPIRSVSEKLGYGMPRSFSEQTFEILGCSPSRLRKDPNAAEVITKVMEWLYKPYMS